MILPRARAAAALALSDSLAACAVPSADLASPKPGAGWVQVSQNAQGVLFLDPRSTLRTGNSVFLTVLDAKRGSTVVLRERVEIDCEGKRMRRHDVTVHADRAAQGPALARAGQTPWLELNPDPKTVFTALANLACHGRAPPGMGTPGAAPTPEQRKGLHNT